MELVYVNPEPDDFTAGVAAFFDSLGWTYLTHRYSPQAQGTLLRVLTLSGLDAWWWEPYTLQVVNRQTTDSAFLQILTAKPKQVGPVALRGAVAEIWTYATSEGASVGKPPICPNYLAAYGYRCEQYVADLQAVYEDKLEEEYSLPWPNTPIQLAKAVIQPVLLRQAVAIMGATAGAIERLMAFGGSNGDRRE